MDFAAIRTGMASAAATVPGLRGVGHLADAINPPCWVSGEVTIDYNKTFSGGGVALTEALFTGRVYVSRADDRAGQALLDSFLNAGSTPASLTAAIEADRTLGGACKTLVVERVHGYGLWGVAGVEYLGVQYDVRVWG